MASKAEVLEGVVHDVVSKCRTLIDGVRELERSSPAQQQLLVAALKPLGREITDILEEYESEVIK